MASNDEMKGTGYRRRADSGSSSSRRHRVSTETVSDRQLSSTTSRVILVRRIECRQRIRGPLVGIPAPRRRRRSLGHLHRAERGAREHQI